MIKHNDTVATANIQTKRPTTGNRLGKIGRNNYLGEGEEWVGSGGGVN